MKNVNDFCILYKISISKIKRLRFQSFKKDPERQIVRYDGDNVNE